ncbi:uncharacterized protein LOC108667322 isoform X2 [Hyalella azteca]|uniref:Uncharacterized protein LOC108667322 isoform X2 n=1 Tax=Hyalella azteca TaxID=294128 RepID=A0A979FTX8_HYAAZ|nr:uncharacterized protein LOC108667322 isoform X2 [Hyalella azteca]
MCNQSTYVKDLLLTRLSGTAAPAPVLPAEQKETIQSMVRRRIIGLDRSSMKSILHNQNKSSFSSSKNFTNKRFRKTNTPEDLKLKTALKQFQLAKLEEKHAKANSIQQNPLLYDEKLLQVKKKLLEEKKIESTRLKQSSQEEALRSQVKYSEWKKRQEIKTIVQVAKNSQEKFIEKFEFPSNEQKIQKPLTCSIPEKYNFTQVYEHANENFCQSANKSTALWPADQLPSAPSSRTILHEPGHDCQTICINEQSLPARFQRSSPTQLDCSVQSSTNHSIKINEHHHKSGPLHTDKETLPVFFEKVPPKETARNGRENHTNPFDDLLEENDAFALLLDMMDGFPANSEGATALRVLCSQDHATRSSLLCNKTLHWTPAGRMILQIYQQDEPLLPAPVRRSFENRARNDHRDSNQDENTLNCELKSSQTLETQGSLASNVVNSSSSGCTRVETAASFPNGIENHTVQNYRYSSDFSNVPIDLIECGSAGNSHPLDGTVSMDFVADQIDFPVEYEAAVRELPIVLGSNNSSQLNSECRDEIGDGQNYNDPPKDNWGNNCDHLSLPSPQPYLASSENVFSNSFKNFDAFNGASSNLIMNHSLSNGFVAIHDDHQFKCSNVSDGLINEEICADQLSVQNTGFSYHCPTTHAKQSSCLCGSLCGSNGRCKYFSGNTEAYVPHATDSLPIVAPSQTRSKLTPSRNDSFSFNGGEGSRNQITAPEISTTSSSFATSRRIAQSQLSSQSQTNGPSSRQHLIPSNCSTRGDYFLPTFSDKNLIGSPRPNYYFNSPRISASPGSTYSSSPCTSSTSLIACEACDMLEPQDTCQSNQLTQDEFEAINGDGSGPIMMQVLP